MAYQRIDYFKINGKQSAAYYESHTGDAWDVFSREPVTVTEDPVIGTYTEWRPTPATKHVSLVSQQLSKTLKESPVTIHPYWSFPIALIGLAIISFELWWLL